MTQERSVRACGLVSLVALLMVACSKATSPDPDTVIINALVVDGSGAPAIRQSVRFAGGTITAIGDFAPGGDDIVIDAEGRVLAPGFVDVHSHHEAGIFEHPDALAAVSQGITTIVAGQDGEHPFPLDEFFARFTQEPGAVNVASYVGHGTLRRLVMGDAYQRTASAAEQRQMQALLREEMAAGALGLGTGLEYDPGSFAATTEVIGLAAVAAEFDGRYISHIRSEDQFFWEAIDELVEIGRQAQIPVQISHVKLATNSWWGEADRLIAVLDTARDAGVEVSADIYPYRAWNTSLSWLNTLFPDRDLSRRDGAEFILEELLSPDTLVLGNYLPDPALNGMTVAEIATIWETDPAATLMALLEAEAARADSAGSSDILGIAMTEADIEALLAWPHTVIGSDGELAGSHPRGFGAFPRFLGHYVRARQVLSLEAAVRKMTALSAAQVGIVDRGLLAVGWPADLVLFDPATVADRATIEDPHNQSVGIDRVWVNGELVFANQRATGSRAGQVIRLKTD